MGDSLSQHQNQQNYRGTSRTTFSSSQSSNSLCLGGNGYEPMIELIISGSTTGGGKQNSVPFNRPNNNLYREKQKY